jgi:hypothetical protein
MNTQPTYETLAPLLAQGIATGAVYATEELAQARRRAASHPQLVAQILTAAHETLADPGFLTLAQEPYYALPRLEKLVEAHLLRPEERYAGGWSSSAGILALLRLFAEAPTWVSHVHKSGVDPTRMMRCDHCAANTAAAMVLGMQALGPALSAENEAFLAQRIQELCLRPFLVSCLERSEHWSKRDYRRNWRIMTCGDAGVAILALCNLPEREALVAAALEGVADVLDAVPPEGDWEEGVGYWTATLYYGLRFALALRRASTGRLDLFQHPALVATCEYLTHVTLPDGSVFNYADNGPAIRPTPLYLLARETRVDHLAWTARRMGHQSFWDMLFDDPALPGSPPLDRPTARTFSASGVAVARSDWSERAFYVGLKSGPTRVGHSQLDVQSFIVAQGDKRLIIDPGYWTQAHFLGSFGEHRWDFDGNAAIGHNTVLVDGQGQTFGGAGRLVASQVSAQLACFVSEAATMYPGLLQRFERWLVFVPPDILLVYDDLASDRPRYWKWLLHSAGAFSGGRANHCITNGDVQLALTRLLPDPDMPWRNTEEVRTSYYQGSDALQDVEHTLHLRSFGPMFAVPEIEFLWAMHLGAPDALRWRLKRPDPSRFAVYAEGADRRLALAFDREAHTCVLET